MSEQKSQSQAQPQAQTQAQPLLSVYLFLGDDKLKKETLYGKLLKRLQSQGDMVFNSVVFDGTQSINTSDLLDALNTMPFASPIRLVSIQDVDKSPKTITDALVDYLADPLATTVLVLTATKLKSDSRLLKAVKKISDRAVVNSESKKRTELPGMVRQMAEGYRFKLSQDGALELIELTGSSTVAINQELQKLAAYLRSIGKNNADKTDVLAVVVRAADPSPWDFVEAFCKRDLTLALELLSKMPGESPISLLALCVMRIRELLLVKSLTARETGNIASNMKRPDWQIRKLQESAQKFTSAELRQLLARAASTDMNMKSGKNPQQQLAEFLLSTCS